MIKVVVAYDHNCDIGQYFEDCKNDIVDFFDGLDDLEKAYTEIPSIRCNVAYIDMIIPQLKTHPFIFIAYTHGKHDSLLCAGNSYVSLANSHHFENSLFYSTACLIGKELAPDLINKGCKAFIGFEEESETPESPSPYKQMFIECDNYGIKHLASSNSTVGQAYEAMQNNYTNKIDYLTNIGEPLFASILRVNRDALICMGDKNLRKEDLFIA